MAEEPLSPGYFSQDNIAAPWWLAGCSLVPIRPDGRKSPYLQWNGLQHQRPTAHEARSWFQGQYRNPGVAVICGRISGNLEMLELEGRAYTDEIINSIAVACEAAGIGDLWHDLTSTGYSELTPYGGLHLLYRVSDHAVPANIKVATRPAAPEEYNDAERSLAERNREWQPTRVLAETRGEGGYVIVAPSPGACHPSGTPWQRLTGSPATMMLVSWEQRELLHAVIRSILHVPTSRELAQVAEPQQQQPKVERDPSAPLSPVEDWNERSSWFDEWFVGQGWSVHHHGADSEIFWCRPGKDPSEQHAATTGVRMGGQDCLFVFSTSTSLPTETPLTKFMVFAHYKFNDDRQAAARWLQRNGYGPALHPPLIEFRDALPEGQEWAEVEGDPPLPDRVVQRHDLDTVMGDLTGGIVLTDTGYAARMRDVYLKQLRYNTTTKGWYAYDQSVGKWCEDSYGYVDAAAQRVSGQTYDWMCSFLDQNVGSPGEKQIQRLVSRAQDGLNDARIKHIVGRFQATEGISATSNDFDATPDLLNLRNGTLSLTNYELREHDPDDMLTCQFKASFEPDADCPNFRKYLDDVFPDVEVQEYIKRCLGYSLTGRPGERALFLLHGPSGTGKSVFIEVMSNLFGDYGVTSPSSTFKIKKQESTFDLHQLRGKRFVAASELPEGMQLDEELIKRITGGGDRIPSRALYQGFVEWVPQCVLWLATNFLPRLSGDDDAIWRRVRTIPMRTVIRQGAQEIRGLGGILTQEGDGILNWMLEGLRDYRRVGLNEPSAILRDVEQYRHDTDTVAQWLQYALLEGSYVIEEDGRLTVSAAYQNYDVFCTDNGVTRYGKARFAKKLSSLNNGLTVETRGGQRVVLGLAQAKRGF